MEDESKIEIIEPAVISAQEVTDAVNAEVEESIRKEDNLDTPQNRNESKFSP